MRALISPDAPMFRIPDRNSKFWQLVGMAGALVSLPLTRRLADHHQWWALGVIGVLLTVVTVVVAFRSYREIVAIRCKRRGKTDY